MGQLASNYHCLSNDPFFGSEGAVTKSPLPISVGMSLWDAEKILICATLEHTGWRVTKAARILGIDRSTLYSKIIKRGIERPSRMTQAWHGSPESRSTTDSDAY
jgi:DNA-binding NtrC family response regulator